MRALSGLGLLVFGIMASLAGCAPWAAPPLNSLAFERRPPPPGQPGYLETIKYVDNGIRYIAADAGFFISATGEMCFQGSVIPGVTLELSPRDYWCISPYDVSMVEALENDTSYVNDVRLWCRHSSPQCAHKIAYPNMFDSATVANSITAETIPFKQERAAVEYLVYLMGGAAEPAGSDEALPPGAPIPLGALAPIPLGALDRTAPAASVRRLTLATEDTR
ncbi:MAG TPA: hypothetical protein VGM07_11420 [Stellaceae bacterium]